MDQLSDVRLDLRVLGADGGDGGDTNANAVADGGDGGDTNANAVANGKSTEMRTPEMLEGPHDDSSETNKTMMEVPKNLAEIPQNSTGMETPETLVGPHNDSAETNKTMRNEPKNLENNSESPIFLDALRPRDLWNFAD